MIVMDNKERVIMNFKITKELDEQWREFIMKKHGGYRKGMYSEEFAAAMIKYMKGKC